MANARVVAQVRDEKKAGGTREVQEIDAAAKIRRHHDRVRLWHKEYCRTFPRPDRRLPILLGNPRWQAGCRPWSEQKRTFNTRQQPAKRLPELLRQQ